DGLRRRPEQHDLRARAWRSDQRTVGQLRRHRRRHGHLSLRKVAVILRARCRYGDGRRRMAAIFTALLLAIVAAGGRASAGSVQIDPVSLELPHDRNSALLSVRNRDSQPISMRVRAYRWSQENGEDVYRSRPALI